MGDHGEARENLALRMVQILPGFGTWASSIRNFETPLGRIGLRQLSILYVMRYPRDPNAEITPRVLANAFDVQPSVITRAVARLEEHGFVVREQDRSDRRVSKLSITDRGREVSIYVENLFVREMMKSTEFVTGDRFNELSRTIDVLSEIRNDLISRKNLGTSDIQLAAAKDESDE